MLRLALTLALGLGLTLGLAWADTDMYDENEDVISKEARSQPPAEEATLEASAAGSHAQLFAAGLEGMDLDSSILGSYFGRGDDLIFGAGPAKGEEAGRVSPEGEVPAYDGQGGDYANENVYGPLWGVPKEAVGLEGYNPWEYFLLMGGDPSQITEQNGELGIMAPPEGQPASDEQPAPKAKPAPAPKEESAPEPHGISCDNDD